MRGYGLLRTTDIEFPDKLDILIYGLHHSKLVSKRKKRNRRNWKKRFRQLQKKRLKGIKDRRYGKQMKS